MQTNDGGNNSGSLLNFSGKGKPQKQSQSRHGMREEGDGAFDYDE